MKKIVLKLGDAVDILSGFAFPSELFNDTTGMPVVRIRDVVRGFSNTRYSGDVDERFVIKNGDILVGMDGNFNVARWNGGSAVLNQRVCKIEARENILDADFLLHLLPKELKKIEDATAFVTVKHLSVKSIRDIVIAPPPLPDQRRIAALLGQADALRAKRREALVQLDILTQSIFVDMFGDPVINPKGWPRVKFASVLENIDSGWSPVCMDRAAQGDEWGVLKLSSITSCEYKDSENKALPEGLPFDPKIEVKPGDLLFSRKNTYNLVAACALVGATRKRLMLSDLIFRFRLNLDAEVEKQYLQSLLIFPTKRIEVQKLASGSSGSMPNISKGRLLALDIEMPPLSLQQIYSTRIKQIEVMKIAHRNSLDKLEMLFESIQHRAFQGEL